MNKSVSKLIATGFGSGCVPFAPGTFASLLAVGAWYYVHSRYPMIPVVQIAIVLIMFISGFIASNEIIEEWGSDPSRVVVDEIVGMWVTCMFLPAGFAIMVLAFVIFRILDILKPFGIRKAEKLPGAWGIMMDDVVAGVVGNIIIQLILISGLHL